MNIENLTKINKQKEKIIKEKETITIGEEKKSFTIENYELKNQISYNQRVCSSDYNCYSRATILDAKQGNSLLEIFFTSSDFGGKEFVDFSMEYGKIDYINNKGESKEISVVDAVNRNYDGNYMYLQVPQDLQEASMIRLVYTVRNKEYTYRLK